MDRCEGKWAVLEQASAGKEKFSVYPRRCLPLSLPDGLILRRGQPDWPATRRRREELASLLRRLVALRQPVQEVTDTPLLALRGFPVDPQLHS